MVNKPKKKGTAAETRIVNYLLKSGLHAGRVVLSGSKDQGDIHIRGGHGCITCVLEVKAGKQTLNVSRKLKDDWLEQTRVEGENSGMNRAVLVIARHGSQVKDYHVWSSDGHRFWYLDEFIEYAKKGF